MKKFIKSIFICMFFSIMFFSCSGSKSMMEESKSMANSFDMAVQEPVKGDDKLVTNIEKKIIKNANIHFKTKNLKNTSKFLADLVNQNSGYISNNNLSNYGNNEKNYLTVRLPAKNFDTFLEALSAKVSKFDQIEIYTEDVTTQFIDYETRLKVKKETEKRYLELLEKANSVQEIIEVERSLQELRSDIESIEGQLKYLSAQIDYSTIYISYYTEATNGNDFISNVIEAFVTGGKLLYRFFLAILTVWPFLLIIVLVIFVTIKFIKKR